MLCLGGAFTTFPCKFGPKNCLSALGVHVHPVNPLATPMLGSDLVTTSALLPVQCTLQYRYQKQAVFADASCPQQSSTVLPHS